MSAIAIDIVREYLDSDDPVTQRNAVKALAALSSHGAADILVDAALDRTNESLRESAVHELGHLGPAVNGAPARLLEARLASPAEGKYVYALLGRLRRAGSPITVTLPRRQLKLGLSLFSVLYPRRKRKPWTRSIRAAAVGGFGTGVVIAVAAIALGFALALLGVTRRQSADAGALAIMTTAAFFAGASALVFTPLATRWASPISLHFDRRVGLWSEAIWAAAGGLIGWSPLLIGSLFSISGVGLIGVLVMPVLAVLLVTPIVVVRCAVALFRPGDPTCRLRRAAVGAAAGLALPAVIALAGSVWFEESALFPVLLACLVPLLSGTAYAYVSIDDEDVVKA